MKKSFTLLFIVSLILLFALPAFCVTLHPSKSNPNKNQDIAYKWTAGMTIGFTGGSVSGYKYAGLISKTSTGSWTGSTWHPPLSAKSVTNICKGKWVPSGGEGEGGEAPPVLYCTAINKGKFPDKIEFVKPTEDKNIAPGDSVSLEIKVKDQDGKVVSGHTINWSVNQTETYFSLAGGTGYTQEVSSSAATPPGTSCTVKSTIKDTTISATSKKITVEIGRIEISPSQTWIWAGNSKSFSVKGYAKDGNECALDSSKVEWTTNCGNMNPIKGQTTSTLAASQTPKSNGTVTAKYYSYEDTANVRVYPLIGEVHIDGSRCDPFEEGGVDYYYICLWVVYLRDSKSNSWGAAPDYPTVWYVYWLCDGVGSGWTTDASFKSPTIYARWDGGVHFAKISQTRYLLDDGTPSPEGPESNTIIFWEIP